MYFNYIDDMKEAWMIPTIRGPFLMEEAKAVFGEDVVTALGNASVNASALPADEVVTAADSRERSTVPQ